MKQARDYQDKAHFALWDFLLNKKGSPVVVAPVGAGKSFMLARFALEAIDKYPGTKILILCHVAELLKQISEEIFEMNPLANVSFYSDKIGEKKLTGQIILGSIQSIYKIGLNIPGGIDICFTDECHLISPSEDTMYKKLFKDMATVNPYMKFIGFTGTNFRSSTGLLTEGEGRMFTDVAYQIPMIDLINKGYLCQLVTPKMKTRMSTEGVKTKGGDYIESQLQKAVDKSDITVSCVDEIIEHGRDRKKWIVFTVGIEHCEHVRDEIRSRGISCEMVTGKTPTAERNKVFNEFKNGSLRCLVNVGVATTGYNNPAIDLLALMRPTKSPVLYTQILGRALRTCAGKDNALILDFGGVIDELGPVDTIDARIANRRAGMKDGEAPIKTCPKCHAVCFASVRECPDCSHQFVFDTAPKLTKSASTAAILSTQVEPTWHDVITQIHTKHIKNGVASMKIEYKTYGGKFYEYVCFEHMGYARAKAVSWHRRRLPNYPVPNKIDAALETMYPPVTRIAVVPEGKYWRVSDVAFDETQPIEARDEHVPILEDSDLITVF